MSAQPTSTAAAAIANAPARFLLMCASPVIGFLVTAAPMLRRRGAPGQAPGAGELPTAAIIRAATGISIHAFPPPEIAMNRILVAACAALALNIAHAQQAPAPKAIEAKAVAPGKAAAAQAVEVRAIVVGLDKAGRTVDLKGPKGRVVTLAVSEEAKNFDQVQLGDHVVVRYMRALTLELKKTGSQIMERSDKSDAVRAKPGERPAAAAARQVQVMANVIAVNAKTKTVTLKGPKGNVVDLVLDDPKQVANIKKGDQVEAIYTEAIAISVEPAPKPAAAAKGK
jgi:hypothetical protein